MPAVTAALIFLSLSSCERGPSGPMGKALRTASRQGEAVVIDQGPIRVEVEKRGRLPLETEVTLLRQSVYGLYSPSVAPYPGAITKQVKCDGRYQYTEVREKVGGFEFRGFKLYANMRYTMGACVQAEVKYAAYRGLIVCANGTLFELRFFQPHDQTLNRFSEYLRLLNCPGSSAREKG